MCDTEPVDPIAKLAVEIAAAGKDESKGGT